MSAALGSLPSSASPIPGLRLAGGEPGCSREPRVEALTCYHRGQLGVPSCRAEHPGLAHVNLQRFPRFCGAQTCAPRRAQTRVPGRARVTHACAGRCREAREREGPAMPSPLPSRGPGATGVVIFSSDMCHLSCRCGRGAAGGSTRCPAAAACPHAAFALRLPGGPAPAAEPGASVGCQPPRACSPPPRYGRSGGGLRGGGLGSGSERSFLGVLEAKPWAPRQEGLFLEGNGWR